MPATIRAAKPADTGAIFALTYELAQFENLTHIFVATEGSLRDALFGARPSIEALVAEDAGSIVGYALFFHNFSSFAGRRGLYLEDVYVQPAQRGSGAAGSAPRFCDTSRHWRWSGNARASSGPCSTGISRRSASIRRWGQRCCRTGASCA
ncbi:GNAT superfamily N-acetyltransferase [Paraburkholderia sp. WSM4175]